MEPIDDPVLGRLEWNTEFNEWQGEILTASGNRAEFSVAEIDLPAGLPFARETLLWLSENEQRLREQLAERMLDLAETWRQEGEPEITVSTFTERVELDHAALHHDGAISLTYLDGEIFGSHLITVTVGANRVMGRPHLVG